MNHVTTEDVQNALDVVLSMFLINSAPASILFDYGVSHSFITSKYVVTYSMPVTTLKYKIIISSLGGEMRPSLIYCKVNLKLRGVDFPANLIILKSVEIDVILGIDWLAKFKGVIECAKNTVTLVNGERVKVEFMAFTPSVEEYKLNHMEDFDNGSDSYSL